MGGAASRASVPLVASNTPTYSTAMVVTVMEFLFVTSWLSIIIERTEPIMSLKLIVAILVTTAMATYLRAQDQNPL